MHGQADRQVEKDDQDASQASAIVSLEGDPQEQGDEEFHGQGQEGQLLEDFRVV